MRAVLTVEENGARRRIEIHGQAVVGRDRECQVILASPTVSRRHATIAPDGEGWRLRDLSSGNGTFVDGKRIDETLLASGDSVRFGTVAVSFEEIPAEAESMSASQRIQISFSQSLTVQPTRRTRTKAAVFAIMVTVVVLLLATLYHRQTSRREPAPLSPTPAVPAR